MIIPISVFRGSYIAKAMSEAGWADTGPDPGEAIIGQHTATYTAGTTVAEVEVNVETGEVKVADVYAVWDCGVPINPMAVEGQWEGAVVQALGATLYEKHEWGEKTGEMLTPCFFNFKMPTAQDIPRIHPIIVGSVDPEGPYGAKEAGLSGSISVSGAIASAIYDAIGVKIMDNPITPEVILKALAEKSEVKRLKKAGN